MSRDRDVLAAGWGQLRRGALQLGALAAGLTLIFFLDVLLREAAEGPELHVVAHEARDLQAGSEVWVAGRRAGRVLEVDFREPGRASGSVVLRAVVLEGAARQLREDASAQIRSPALLRPTVLALEPGASSRPFDFSDTLAARALASREEVRAGAERLSERLRSLEPLAARLAGRLRQGPGTVARLRGDSLTARRLRTGLARLERLLEGSRDGTAARLLADTALHHRLVRVRERGAELLAAGGAEADSARARLRHELDALAARLDEIDRRLAGGRGSAARFLTDRELTRQAALFRARLDSVREELTGAPLRWLRLRLF